MTTIAARLRCILPPTLAVLSLSLVRPASGERSSFVGKQEIEPTVTATAADVKYARTFTPKFDLSVEVDPSESRRRKVVVTDQMYAEPYECQLAGQVKAGVLTLDALQSCELAIATPDFCVLTMAECSAHPTGGRKCETETSHLGRLKGILIEGSVASDSGKWKLSATFSVEGCVLVHGHNHNAPVKVRGGKVLVMP